MDQLYRISDLLAPAVTALLGDIEGERRLARQRYAQSGPAGGRFGDVLRGWAGQAAVIRARLTKEVMATRLDSCEGRELRDLAKSEYLAELPSEPKKAVGEAILYREIADGNPSNVGSFTAGTIPAGTRIKRVVPAAPDVPTTDAEFVTLVAVHCSATDDSTDPQGGGVYVHRQTVTVSIEATCEGPHANLTYYELPYGVIQGAIASELFDPDFEVIQMRAAGGTLGVVDDQIRALARALATGSAGPTTQAVIAGALTNSGVRHVAYVNDPVNAVGRLFVADESWASSVLYRDQLLKGLRAHPWIGWGCKVVTANVVNIGTTVRPTVLLRSRDYVPAQAAITANIHTALQAYFDDRPDWYTWTLNAIGAVVGAADDRILACTAVSVEGDMNSTAAVDEAGLITGTQPEAEINPGTTVLPHFALVGSGVTPIYKLPGD